MLTYTRIRARSCVLASIVLLGACGGNAAPPPTAAPTTSLEEPTPEASGSPRPNRPASPKRPEADFTVTVANGKVSGVPGTVEVGVGDEVDFIVVSDAADEVHVHGYDVTARVAPNKAAHLRFTADIPGGFEVELEEAGIALFELRVS